LTGVTHICVLAFPLPKGCSAGLFETGILGKILTIIKPFCFINFFSVM